MKLLIVLATAVLAVLAVPVDVGKDFELGQELDFGQEQVIDFGQEQGIDFNKDFDSYVPVEIGAEDAANYNGTARNIPFGQAGFATYGGGTRGGTGGAVWTVWDAFALRDALNSNDRRIVYVRGRIDLTVLFVSSPGVALRVGSYTSVIGGDRNAMIFGGGLTVNNVRQVIIQNIRFHNALSYAPGERPNGNGGILGQVPGAFSTVDNIGVQNSHHVWIDHCEFADDPWNANNTPDNRRRHDGLIDITRGAHLISVSNSLFRNHNMVMLVGNDDNNGAQDRNMKVTYYLNWFQGTTQRHPRVRHGEVHILNNLYTDIRSYAVGAGAGARIYGERNVFINTRRSWGFPAGTPNPMGFFFNDNNLLRNSQHDSGIPWNGVNWRPNQYYGYVPMNVNNVEAHVRRFAGIW